MKKMMICALMMAWATVALQAQTTRKKTTTRKTSTTTRTASSSAKAQPVLSAVSTGNYAARASAPAAGQLTISDPTINALNARANGSDVRISNSGIVGMPKRAYGFAGGRLMLNASGSTTSGTMTGSGAVGTGSSLGTIGSNGPAIGLNGKSPYAGSTMWGNARGMTLRYGDSAIRGANGRRN